MRLPAGSWYTPGETTAPAAWTSTAAGAVVLDEADESEAEAESEPEPATVASLGSANGSEASGSAAGAGRSNR